MKRLFEFSKMPWRFWFRKSTTDVPRRHWYPTRFLLPDDTGLDYALLILNSPKITETWDSHYIATLWSRAKLRACADGGANKLAAVNDLLNTSYYPDFVCGDLDSVRKENLENFKRQGSVVYEDTSVDSTDFTKSARILAKRLQEKEYTHVTTIITIGGLYGRFDHVMGCLNTLVLLQKEYPRLSIYCLQHYSLFTLLSPGQNLIHIDDTASSGVCGLAPIGGASEVTTTGLKWNLNNQTLAFGTLVSTSNMVTSSQVNVITNSPLLWILNLKSDNAE